MTADFQHVCLCVAGLIHVGDELKKVSGIPADDNNWRKSFIFW